MTTRTVHVEIETEGVSLFRWVVKTDKPVEKLFRSAGLFTSRAAALRDFQRTCELLGWSNDVVEVPAGG